MVADITKKSDGSFTLELSTTFEHDKLDAVLALVARCYELTEKPKESPNGTQG